MKQSIFRIKTHTAFLGLLVAMLFVSFIPLVQAQEQPAPPATTTEQTPLVTAGPGEQSIADFLCTPENNTLYSCVNRLYRFGVVAGFFIAVMMIVVAGYMYMTGGEAGKAKGKSYIESTFVAIVILLTSYMLLNQINPDLVTFKRIQPLAVDPEDLKELTDEQLFIAYEDGQLTPEGAAPSNGTVVTGCSGTIVTIPRNEFQQYDNNTTCSTTLDALRRLAQLTNAAGIAFGVNDSIGQAHQSRCHKVSGTCVDIGVLGKTTYDQLCKVINDSKLFNIFNESGKTTPNCGVNHNTQYGTGPHLHLNLVAP